MGADPVSPGVSRFRRGRRVDDSGVRPRGERAGNSRPAESYRAVGRELRGGRMTPRRPTAPVNCVSPHETRRIVPNEDACHSLRARAESSVHTHQARESFAGAVRGGLRGYPKTTVKAAGASERRGSPKRVALGRGTKDVAVLYPRKRTLQDMPGRASLRGTGWERLESKCGQSIDRAGENLWGKTRIRGLDHVCISPARPFSLRSLLTSRECGARR